MIYPLFLLLLCLNLVLPQGEIVDLSPDGILTIEADEESEEDTDEPKIEKQILVLANHFPDYLNFFCYPRTRLMRDRFCFGGLDAYAMACSNENPPLPLVPFCIGYKFECDKVSFPTDHWCAAEFNHYERHCTLVDRNPCKNCHYDISCTCEPYDCLLRRAGTRTAEWCQRYELYCNATAREDKRNELSGLLSDAVTVHKQCVELYGLAHAICNPFGRNFQWERCQKFLFDCELISDFPEEEGGEVAEEEEAATLTPEQLAILVEEAHRNTTNPELQKAQLAEAIRQEKHKIHQQIVATEQAATPQAPLLVGPVSPIHGGDFQDFFVGHAVKQGNRLVINPVRIEPGQVVGSPPAPAPEQQRGGSGGGSIVFKPEEVISLATDVAGGKVKVPKPQKRNVLNGRKRDEINEDEWATHFLPPPKTT